MTGETLSPECKALFDCAIDDTRVINTAQTINEYGPAIAVLTGEMFRAGRQRAIREGDREGAMLIGDAINNATVLNCILGVTAWMFALGRAYEQSRITENAANTNPVARKEDIHA